MTVCESILEKISSEKNKKIVTFKCLLCSNEFESVEDSKEDVSLANRECKKCSFLWAKEESNENLELP